LAVPGWALLDFCSILGEIGKASHVPAIGQRASIRHVQLLFQLSSYDQFEEDIHQRINQGCEIVSIKRLLFKMVERQRNRGHRSYLKMLFSNHLK